MTTSTAVPSPVPTGTDGHRSRDLSKRRSKKKILTESDNNRKVQSVLNLRNDDYETVEWKSDAQQQVYRSKLHKALRQIRLTGGNDTGTSTVVRETADRVLAATAKGRTRWSRAILTNKLQLKFVNNRRQRGLIVTATGNSRLRRPRVRIPKLKRKNLPVVNRKNLPAVQRKARVLGGLVPGCRKQSLPVVLKEATDYIPALEMQVKAMAALVELLSGGASSASGASGSAGDVDRLSLKPRPSPCL